MTGIATSGETPIDLPLGRAIPPSPHAISVSLPRWSDVIGYEESDPAILAAIASGYPRFVLHPAVRDLNRQIEVRFATPGERALVWPSASAAERCIAHLARHGHAGRMVLHEDLVAVLFPGEALPIARQSWQHAGEIVSSRRALAALEGRGDHPAAPAIKEALKQRLSEISGIPAPCVHLFPTGMAALHRALRLIQAPRPGLPTVQFGFPYVDTLKLQERMGTGTHFFPMGHREDLDALERLLTSGQVSGVFTEVPTNPLMQTVDLPRLSRMTRQAGVPLVVDDSAATFYNLDLRRFADVLVSSLTKHLAGHGEAMGGCLLLNPDSPHFEAMTRILATEPEDLLWGEDAEALLHGSETFSARMPVINRNAETLAKALVAHPAVARVFHPSLDEGSAYRTLMRPGGGFGGMLSIVLNEPARLTPGFYDRLEAAKGPSFGMRSTLVCPYTLLAHYPELDWAERSGVSRELIRISVGLEAIEILIDRFTRALSAPT
jgi:cystathionine gamma-synthase